mmetsp:Transcript_12817/g.25953  ORF Transcript_12817/g.25953 Transcript_12817/m.25953 type:complete len:313 (+) Transcript_12817:112-1050(+)
MDEGSLGIHQVKLVIDARKHLRDGRTVGDHAASTHHLREVAARHYCWWLVVDAALESRGAPVDELDGTLRLDCCDRGIDILRHNIAAVHHATRHVLAVARVALHEHGRWLEDAHRDLGHGKLLMVSFLRGNDGRIRRQHEMDARVWHQVRLELGDVHVQRTVKSKRRRQGRDDLCQQPIEICVGRALNVEVPSADIVQRFIVIHNRHICVLEERMNAKDRVVRLHHGRRHLGARPHGEAELALFAVVHGEALQHQAAEAGAGAAAASVVDHEALQACAVVGQLADAVQHQIDNLLANRVMPTREVVRGVLLA